MVLSRPGAGALLVLLAATALPTHGEDNRSFFSSDWNNAGSASRGRAFSGSGVSACAAHNITPRRFRCEPASAQLLSICRHLPPITL